MGAVIRAYRKFHVLTVPELAKRIQAKPSRVTQWEQGRSSPSLPYLQALMIVLGINPAFLVNPGDLQEPLRKGAKPCRVNFHPLPTAATDILVEVIEEAPDASPHEQRVALDGALRAARRK